jgi:hypothetical protein
VLPWSSPGLPLTPCDRASGDFAHAVDGDAGALFDSERVVGGFELDEGALADRAGVDVGLQVDGAGGSRSTLRTK